MLNTEIDNLTVIIDVNSLIILGNTSDCLKINPIKEKIDGLGIDTQEVDGHNINDELISALSTSDASQTFNCIANGTTKDEKDLQ